MTIPYQALVARLVSEWAYSPEDAEFVVHQLQACTPEVQHALQRWWQGFDAQLVVQGYSLPRLMQEYHLGPMAALLTLDWLIREPDVALHAISQGSDRIE